jgi:AbiJ N-terminal domain 4
MSEEIIIPFSARNRGLRVRIDNTCPETVRTGLFYLLKDLVERRFVPGWKEVKTELARIDRFDPSTETTAQQLLSEMEWDKVFDFCERLHNHLAQEVTSRNFDEVDVIVPRSEVQKFIATELQGLFLEENLAFEFSNGLVRRRGRRNTTEQIARAELVLGDPRLSSALKHYKKALQFFRNVPEPDFENAVKEVVCAVEATARALFPDGGSTLGRVVNSITGTEAGKLPEPIAKTFHGLFGFGNGGEGVRHGGTTGGAATKELAEYVLAVAACQIVLLVDLAVYEDIPF